MCNKRTLFASNWIEKHYVADLIEASFKTWIRETFLSGLENEVTVDSSLIRDAIAWWRKRRSSLTSLLLNGVEEREVENTTKEAVALEPGSRVSEEIYCQF